MKNEMASVPIFVDFFKGEQFLSHTYLGHGNEVVIEVYLPFLHLRYLHLKHDQTSENKLMFSPALHHKRKSLKK